MDRRLVFRPYPRSDEAPVTQGGSRRVPIGHGTFLLDTRKGKGAGEVATTVKATAVGLDWREKPGGEGVVYPYRKPTLVGGCKRTKVGERTFVKELGNLTP